MNLIDVIEEAFIVSPDNTVSNVISKMSKNKNHEVFIFDNKFIGIATLNDIIKRRVTEPDKTKISYFAKTMKPFPVETSVSDVINYMMVSEYRSVPVENDGKIYAVNKSKLLGFVKDSVFEGKVVKDVMQFPYCASENDDIKTVISTMKEIGASILPILSKDGKFVGIADGLSLAEVIMGMSSTKRGNLIGEKEKLNGIGIKKFTRMDVAKVSPDESLKSVVKKVMDENAYTIIVEKGEKFVGLITAKDIFKLIGKSLETVYVRVSGLDDEDEFIKKKIDDMIENTVSKLLRIIPINYVAIHADMHQTSGRKIKYSIQGRFVTERGNFFANDSEWDSTKAIKNFLDKIERNVHKKIDKKRKY